MCPSESPAEPASEPTPEEVAAIAAAVEALWPRPVVVVGGDTRPTPWRFSGRWWLNAGSPIPTQRQRP